MTDEDTFRWDAAALRDEALDCLTGQHTELHKDDRANELLRALGLALLASYEQKREFFAAALEVLRQAKDE